MKFSNHLAILSAMPEEIGSILNNLTDIKKLNLEILLFIKVIGLIQKQKN